MFFTNEQIQFVLELLREEHDRNIGSYNALSSLFHKAQSADYIPPEALEKVLFNQGFLYTCQELISIVSKAKGGEGTAMDGVLRFRISLDKPLLLSFLLILVRSFGDNSPVALSVIEAIEATLSSNP